MNIPLDTLLKEFDTFLLVLVRMTGLFVIAPIFGRRNIPVMLKIGFSFFLSVILVNTIELHHLDYSSNVMEYFLLVIKEFIVGITIGYVSYIIFSSIYIAGQLIDMQIGFGMVNVIDPISNIQVPITSNLYFILSMLFFLSFNGHHLLIRALFSSYQSIPLGGAEFNTSLMNHIIGIFGEIFIIGFQIAAPVITAIFITDIILGVVTRTIPQLNVFVVGMPLKILVGLLIIFLTMPAFISFTSVMVGKMNGEMANFIKDLGP